jgi:hypothetical protein
VRNEGGKVVRTVQTKDRAILWSEIREFIQLNQSAKGALGGGQPADGDDDDDEENGCCNCYGQSKSGKEKSCQDTIVIFAENPYYRAWDFFVVICCILSSYIYMHFAAFGNPGGIGDIFDYVFLAIFGVDIFIRK